MSGSPLAAIVIPIVAFAGLFVAVALPLYADRHPQQGRGGARDRDITGGIFRGDPRQQMPHPDASPAAAASHRGGGHEGGRPGQSGAGE
jgi:hypothetical protein